jgi:hypothetical protein
MASHAEQIVETAARNGGMTAAKIVLIGLSRCGVLILSRCSADRPAARAAALEARARPASIKFGLINSPFGANTCCARGSLGGGR